MTTYRRNELETIDAIWQRLQDYAFGEDGAVLLTELMQNADDADATVVRFVFLADGIPDAKNPLLRGPATLFFNDGPFSVDDRDGLTSLSSGTKSKKRGKIGRFGVGQKSVFHLCEAFFFAGTAGTEPMFDVVNPWASPSTLKDAEQPEWDSLEDRDAVLKAIEPLTAGHDSWLVLWLPHRLQSHAHAEEKNGFIKSPGNEPAQFEGMLVEGRRILHLLPHLTSIERVELWRRATGSVKIVREMVTHIEGTGRLGRVPDEPAEWIRHWSGRMFIDGEVQAYYWGWEQLSNLSELERWKALEQWPRRKTRGPSGRSVSEPDKADGHGAATLLAFVGSRRKHEAPLLVRWATYLPVPGPSQAVTWSLMLHGAFLPDHSRRMLAGSDVAGEMELTAIKLEEDVRAGWNRSLRDRITLKCLLPLLDEVARSETAGADPKAVRLLISNLPKDDIIKPHLAAVCERHDLLAGLRFDGDSASTTWRLFPAGDRRVVTIPTIKDKGACRLAKLLVDHLDVDVSLCEEKAPSISAGKLTAEWQPEWIRRALPASEFASMLGESEVRRYIVELANSLKGPAREAFAFRLHEALRLALLGRRDPLAHDESSVELVSLLSPGSHLVISDDVTADVVFSAAEASSILLLQGPFVVPPKTGVHWSADAVSDLLTWTTTKAGRFEKSLMKTIAEQIGVENIRGDATARNLPMFRGRWQRRGSEESLSANAIDKQKTGVFIDARSALVRAFINAANDEIDILLIEEHPLERMHGKKRADTKTLVDYLGHHACLRSDLGPRVDLMRQVADDIVRQGFMLEFTRGLRYLLHGQARQHGSNATLWHGVDARFERMAGLSSEGWRCIPGSVATPLTDRLTDDEKKQLGLAPAIDVDVVQLARQCLSPPQVDELSALCAKDADFAGWLSEKTFHQAREVWKQLPLHRCDSGQRAADGTRPLLRPGKHRPRAEFLGLVDLLIESPNEILAMHQRDAIQTWSSRMHVRVALSLPADAREAALLEALFGDDVRLDDETRSLVTCTEWIRIGGSVVAPNRVWVGDETTYEVLCMEKAGFLALRHVLNKSGIEKVGQLHAVLPKVGDVLAALHEELRKNPEAKLFIGPIRPDQNWTDLEELTQVLPGWRFLATVKTLAPDLFDRFRGLFATALSPRTLQHALRALAGCKLGSAQDQAAVAYLTQLLEHPEFEQGHLRGVQLRNAAGRWVEASQVALIPEQTNPAHAPHASIRALLEAVLPQSSDPNGRVQSSGPADDDADELVALRKVFGGAWRNQGVDTLIGVFLSLLGDGRSGQIRKFAQGYLPSNILTPEVVRDRVLRQMVRQPAGPLDYWPRLRNFVSTMERGSRLQCVAVTGEMLAIPLEGLRLFVDGGLVIVGDNRHFVFKLAMPNGTDRAERGEYVEALKDAIVEVVRRLHGRTPTAALTDFLKSIQESTQLSVKATAALINEEIEAHLRPLRIQSPELLRAIAERTQLRLEAAHLDENTPPSGNVSGADAKRRQQIRDEIKRRERDIASFLSDSKHRAIQEAILDGLRTKILDHGYTPARVLLELFQNADDAVTQNEWLNSGRTPGDEKFIVSCGPSETVVTHFGRPINDVGPDRRGEERGYQTDLRAMLLLHVSDKPGDPRVTGHFGLGFKSVFLITDQPLIRSGNLDFLVAAGLLPINHDSGREKDWDPSLRATRFRLRHIKGIDEGSVLASVRPARMLLPVFAKAIRRIELPGVRAEWQARFRDSPLEIGVVVESRHDQPPAEQRVLLATAELSERRYAVAMLLRNGVVEALPDDLPTVWVTAPTEERFKLGFAVSGPFKLNTGRSEVANPESPENQGVAETLGRILGEALGRLMERLNDKGPRVREQLGLGDGPQVEPAFWESVWKTLGSAVMTTDARAAIPKVVARRGLAALASRHGAPNGLDGSWGAIVGPGDWQWTLSPELSKKEGLALLDSIAGLLSPAGGRQPPFRRNTHSAERAKIVEGLLVSESAASTLTLAKLLDWLPVQVTPANAADLGDVVAFGQHSSVSSSSEAVQGWLRRLTFPCADGVFRDALGVVASEVPPAQRAALADDLLVAGFAPASSTVLLGGSDALTKLFVNARGRSELEISTLVQWAESAGPAHRDAVLRYLANGRHKGEVARLLGSKGLDWLSTDALADAVRRGVVSDTTGGAIEVGLRSKSLSEIQKSGVGSAGRSPSVEPPAEPKRNPDILEMCYRWWLTNQDRETEAYNRALYGVSTSTTLRDRLLQGDDDAWFELLALGALHRIGRTHHSTHRNFISKQRAAGRWTKMVEGKVNASAWIKVLDSVIDREDDGYQDWYSMFPLLYQCARHLETYRDVFLGLPRRPGASHPGLDVLLSPRRDPALSGSGRRLRAPSLAMRMPKGVHWVIRELLRLGVIEDERLHRYAWVRTNRVGEFLETALQVSTKNIPAAQWSENAHRAINQFAHESGWLDDPTFGGAFDVALHRFAYSREKALRQP